MNKDELNDFIYEIIHEIDKHARVVHGNSWTYDEDIGKVVREFYLNKLREGICE